MKVIDTGDIGEIKQGTVYYRGRKDDIIKRFGHKVNLLLIESIIMQCPRVKTCSCIWLPKPMLLVVYFSSETLSSKELSDFLKCKLDDKHWPDSIIKVDSLPMNTHGKISKLLLSKMYETVSNVPQTLYTMKVSFLKELQAAMNKHFTYDDIKDQSFIAIGGTSFLAVAVCNKLSQSYPKFAKLILPHLLTNKNTIEDIMQKVQKEVSANEKNGKKKLKRMRSDFNSSASLSWKKVNIKDSLSTPVEFIVLWSHDTGKCVDASPTLHEIE